MINQARKTKAQILSAQLRTPLSRCSTANGNPKDIFAPQHQDLQFDNEADILKNLRASFRPNRQGDCSGR